MKNEAKAKKGIPFSADDISRLEFCMVTREYVRERLKDYGITSETYRDWGELVLKNANEEA